MFKRVRKFLNRRKNLKIILDFLGAIAIWWGLWGLLDLFIFPQNQLLSYVVSIAIGFFIMMINGSSLEDLK